MKKIFLLLICVSTLLCGCNSKKETDNFEHYDLIGKDLNQYFYIDSNGKKEEYVLADVTKYPSESAITGLFYKVGPDDYILLNTFESAGTFVYKSDQYRFYKNKLYGVGKGHDSFEVELNGRDSKFKEITYTVDNQAIFPEHIEYNIEDDFIYFSGIIFDGEHNVRKSFKCSLINYQCQIYQQE